MNDKAKKIRNEYMKNWRARNKDKVKAVQQRYWEKKAMQDYNKYSNVNQEVR